MPYGKKFHAIGIAAICWAIWKMRNKVCFEDKRIHDPATILCYACALIQYWAGLSSKDDKEQLKAGVETMLRIAIQLLSRKSKMDGYLQNEDGDGNNQGV